MSRKEIPNFSFAPKKTVAKKLLDLKSNNLSSVVTPGVMISVTPLLTIFLSGLGFSSCSQIATRKPERTKRGNYKSKEWYGKPASSMSEPPLFRLVSVIPSAAEVFMASAPKVS